MSTPTAAPSVPSLGSQKLAQAQSLLAEAGLDAWLMVVRETQERPDPTLRYFVDLAFTWNTYFLITRDGALALAATFDAPDLLALGLFDEVRTYKEGPREALLEMLASRNPARIGINVSEDDALADGLTAGLRDSLETMLRGTPFEGRLQSAEGLVGAVRVVKLAEEADAALATGGGPVRLSVRVTWERAFLPLFAGISLLSAVPPGSLLERLIVASAANGPITTAAMLRLLLGFAATPAAPGASVRAAAAWTRGIVRPAG